MAERGEAGVGRMAEVPQLVAAHRDDARSCRANSTPAIQIARSAEAARGRHVLVTSGPTHEAIDPVRFIGNRSSGKQGHAIAAAAAKLGARVTPDLGAGVAARSCRRRGAACGDGAGDARGGSARRCRPTSPFSRPPSPTGASRRPEPARSRSAPACRRPKLELVENPDILKTIAKRGPSRPALVIGFAAETEAVIEHAIEKRKTKGADWIVANDVSPARGVFGGDAQLRPSRHRRRCRVVAAHEQGRSGGGG